MEERRSSATTSSPIKTTRSLGKHNDASKLETSEAFREKSQEVRKLIRKNVKGNPTEISSSILTFHGKVASCLCAAAAAAAADKTLSPWSLNWKTNCISLIIIISFFVQKKNAQKHKRDFFPPDVFFYEPVKGKPFVFRQYFESGCCSTVKLYSGKHFV